ncbi:hypothetical protein B566_EDAN019292 [Ephemera danica]|nr:hypothetical protein B566_EDAN019292 [Ephemera danica]
MTSLHAPVVLDIAGTHLTAADKRRLRHPLTGGLILFARNWENRAQLTALCAAIKAQRPDVLICVDHEGGRVQRFKTDGFTHLPPMRVLGERWMHDAMAATDAASAVGYVLAAELRACGVDLSFTPVLDLDHGGSSVIGDRAFHRDARVATLLAKSVSHGLLQAGMAHCGKHFPGHGFVKADSHTEIPVLVRHQQHGDALLEFNFRDLGALLVQQEAGHLHRHLHMHGGGVFLHRLFLHHAQDLQRGRFRVANMAGAVAARAGDVAAFAQCRAQALAAHFEQPKLADGAELHAGAVVAQGVAQAVFHLAAVLGLLHVDEVHDDQAAQVAQAHLAGDFVGRFQVGAGGGFLDVAAAGGTRGVHVHAHQRLGVVDDDGAARRQIHRAAECRFDLMLDLETAEQRRVVAVALHAIGRLRHHVVHELRGLIEDGVGVDQDFTDVGGEVVADGADDERAFLVDQVPLQFSSRTPDARGAGDQAHAFGVFKLVEVFLQLFAVFALDAARNATAARVVGHQHQVAAGQADKGGQGRALVAALFLFHLHQQFGAFLDGVADLGVLHIHAFAEVIAADFLERQEAVAVFAVINEAGFERRLDPRDHGLVDVALALFAPFDFGFEIDQLLPVDDGQAPLFRLRGIDQHAFH